MTTDTRALARDLPRLLRLSAKGKRMESHAGSPLAKLLDEAADTIEALSLTPRWEEADVNVAALAIARVISRDYGSEEPFEPIIGNCRRYARAAFIALSTLTPPPHDPEEGEPNVS